MNTAQQLPILANVDRVILGSSSPAVAEALSLAEAGYKVALVTSRSFLGTEELTLHTPPDTLPDHRKKQLEESCRSAGITLLYGVWVVDRTPREKEKILVRLAGKFGLAGILTRRVEDFREELGDITFRAWLTNRDAPEQIRILETENPAAAEPSLARRLLGARMALLHRYQADGLEEKWRLGRFALRGAGQKKAPSREEKIMKTHRVLSRQDPSREGKYPVLTVDGTLEGCALSYDVVVAGGGTSGCMAALAAARGGCRVALVEPGYALGGTGTIGGVSAYWFGTRYRDTDQVDQLVKTLTPKKDWKDLPGLWGPVDSWNPDIKATALLKLLVEAGVEVHLGTVVFGIWEGDNRPAGVAAAGEDGVRFLRGTYLLDATGDGDLAVFAGADFQYGNDRDCLTYWASLAQYPRADTYRNNFSAMMCLDDPLDYTRFVLEARHFGEGLFDHGSCGVVRESRHIRGKTWLTLKDLICHTHFPDTLYTCYSNYDPKGKVTADMVYCGALPPQTKMEIPLSALTPVTPEGNRIPGLYVLGKAISASHDVFPSIRMQKDLMHQGAVMGNLIAHCRKLGTAPEALPPKQLSRLTESFSGDPCYAPAAGSRNPEDWIKALSGKVRTHWVDAGFTDCENDRQPYLELMCAERERVLPLVKAALESGAEAKARPFLLRLSIWHGSETYCQEFVKELENRLAGDTLPERTGPTTCVQLLPDHGVMPEPVYDLNLLAYVPPRWCEGPFSMVFSRIIREKRDYNSISQGVFPYLESFAFVAERNGSVKLLDWLEALSELPELAKAQELPRGDLLKERLLMLRYLMYRALAANGRRKGYEGLLACLNRPQLPLSHSARQSLAALAGVKTDYEAWLARQSTLPQKRITTKTF